VFFCNAHKDVKALLRLLLCSIRHETGGNDFLWVGISLDHDAKEREHHFFPRTSP